MSHEKLTAMHQLSSAKDRSKKRAIRVGQVGQSGGGGRRGSHHLRSRLLLLGTFLQEGGRSTVRRAYVCGGQSMQLMDWCEFEQVSEMDASGLARSCTCRSPPWT